MGNDIGSGLSFNPIPTGLCHVITVYGLIQPMAGRNKVKPDLPANLAQSFFQNRPAFTSKQQSFNSLVLEKQAYVSW